MKDKILAALNFDTISLRDTDGHLFEGINKKDFNELADRLFKLFEENNITSNNYTIYDKYVLNKKSA